MRAKTRIGQKLPLSSHTSVFSLVSSVQLKIPPKINILPLDFLRSLNHCTNPDSPESEEADKYRCNTMQSHPYLNQVYPILQRQPSKVMIFRPDDLQMGRTILCKIEALLCYLHAVELKTLKSKELIFQQKAPI